MARLVERLAKGLAIVGVVALAVIILVTIISITGRALIWAGLKPILGDYEIVEGLTGFAVFCFLPICQLSRGHAIIDVLTKVMGPRLVRIVDALAEMLMALALVLIAWRLTAGLVDKWGNHQITIDLQMPLWILYAICVPPAWIAFLTAVFTSSLAIKSVITGRDILPEHQGFE